MHDYPPTYSSPRDVDLRRQAGKPLFGLGRLVATPGALNILTTAQCHPVQLLQRHQHGDWCDPGELCTADKAAIWVVVSARSCVESRAATCVSVRLASCVVARATICWVVSAATCVVDRCCN